MTVNSEYSRLVQKLEQFIRKYYKNLLIRGAIYSFGLLVLFFISATSLEYFGEFDTTMRTVLFYTFVLSSVFVLSKYIVVPLLKLNKLGKVLSHEEAANIIGLHFKNVADKLTNVLQLNTLSGGTYSTSLLEASIDQKISELKPIPFTAAINFSENKKHLKFVAIPVALLFIILLGMPAIITTGSERLIKHGSYFEKKSPFTFNIKNKSLNALQQEDFVLEIKIDGSSIPDEVFIEVEGNEFKLSKEKVTEFNYTFKNVQADIPFRLNASGFESQEYKLLAIPKPAVLDFEVSLKYPAYLNRKAEILRNSGDLILPQGTIVSWRFNAKNTEHLFVRFPDTTLNIVPTGSDVFSITKRFLRGSNYSVKATNKYVIGADSMMYSLNVIPDAHPAIEVKERKDTVNTKVIYFSGIIKDDYGFKQLNFHYTHYKSADSTGEAKSESKIQALSFQPSQNSQPFIHATNLTELNIGPGDKIEYYFEVWDNDGVNGSKSSRSNIMVFKAPTLEELDKSTGQNNKEIKEDLEESLKKAKDIQKDLKELNKKMFDKKQLGWEEKKQMEDLLNKQKELEKKLDQIKQENQKNNQEQNEYKQADEKILEKQAELEKLFENIMTPEMKKMFDDLQKMLEKLNDKNKVQDIMEKMKMSNKDIEKELDRALEQFKQMEAEQKMEKIANKMEELAKKQDELSKETENKNSDQKDLEKKQEELNKKFDELKKESEELKKLNENLENKLPVPDQSNKQEEVKKEQQNSSEQLEKKENKKAAKSQKKAAEKMQEMAAEMKTAMEQKEEEQNEEDMQSLRQIMENLINLSFSQENLIKETQIVKINDPKYGKLGQTQKKLQDDARLIEDSLLALSKRNPKISATVNREINAIQNYMNKSVEELVEARSPMMGTGNDHKQSAQSSMQYSMTSVNNLALLLNESLEAMREEAKKQQQKKGGGGACKKPGKKSGQGEKPNFASMRQMQEQLNKQMEQMKKMMEKEGNQPNGKKPGQKPGNTGGMGSLPGMSEQFAKMAAEQEAIRRAMQEAMQKAGGKEAGGNMFEKMEETENDLVNKAISQETINRQQQILTKLLEHEKAEREKEFDEQRKSNEAKTENYSNPELFLEYKRLKEQEMELLRTVSPSLNPYYRSKVSSYFNSFTK